MTHTLASHKFSLSYEGGIADQHLLPGYDGAKSLDGMIRAIEIALHFYMNGETVQKATALRGAEIYLKPSRAGSYDLPFIIEMLNQPATAVGATLLANPLYDFFKLVFRRATGTLDAQPLTPAVKRLLEADETLFDDLSMKLEGSLADGHKPIGKGVETVTLRSARLPIIRFDIATKEWVTETKMSDTDENYTIRVTRFNSVTRNARAYIEELDKIIPFRPDHRFQSNLQGNFTWSLHGSTTDRRNRLRINATPVLSSNGKIKRLLVNNCERV